jgi:hypothetical protein
VRILPSMILSLLLTPGQINILGARHKRRTKKIASECRQSWRVTTIDLNQQPIHFPPPGAGCLKKRLADSGKPVMFSAHDNGVAFGVSSAPDRPRHLTLWVDNQTDTSMTFFVCCSAFLLTHIPPSSGSKRHASRLQKAQTGRN